MNRAIRGTAFGCLVGFLTFALALASPTPGLAQGQGAPTAGQQWSLSFGVSDWLYEEYDRDDNLFVKHSGFAGDIGLSHRRLFGQLGQFAVQAVIDGDLTVGQHDYFSDVSGELSGQGFDQSGIAAQLFALWRPESLPFLSELAFGAGLGQRSYQEVGRGLSIQQPSGVSSAFYDRRTWYVYTPFSFRASFGDPQATFYAEVTATRRDLLVGQQTSHFEHVYGPENSMTFFNRQEEGTGTKIAPMVGWRLSDATVLEVRYVQEIWTVADSETAYILVRRPNDSGVYEGEILGYYEPRNNSRKNVLFVGIGSSM